MISVANYAELRSRVEKRIKYSGNYLDSLFEGWVNQTIYDVERSVPLQYSLQTKEIELSAGDNKIVLEGLIRGKEHAFTVGIKVASNDEPCEIPRVKDLPIGADVRTYTADERGIPDCYYPLALPNADDEMNPGILLIPPANTEATHVYVRGYFHSMLPAPWADDDVNWLMRNYPDVLIHGVAMKANLSLGQQEDAAIEDNLYRTALLGDQDMGKNGLLQAMRASEQSEPRDMRMRLVPGIGSAEYIGVPDYYHRDSIYYDPYFDYENQRYLPRG